MTMTEIIGEFRPKVSGTILGANLQIVPLGTMTRNAERNLPSTLKKFWNFVPQPGSTTLKSGRQPDRTVPYRSVA
jgi:hypothetical protein